MQFGEQYIPQQNGSYTNQTQSYPVSFLCSQEFDQQPRKQQRHRIAPEAVNEFERIFSLNKRPSVSTMKQLAEQFKEDFTVTILSLSFI